MSRTFTIDCFHQAVERNWDHVVVAVDVIRATTTAITAVSTGRRCFVAESLEDARRLAKRLRNSLLVGEQNGEMGPGFDLQNSPVAVARHADRTQPIILLTSSGSRLMCRAGRLQNALAACFRNERATASHLIQGEYAKVALIGAGTYGEPRDEDMICCARIGRQLLDAGFLPESKATEQALQRWADCVPEDCLVSKSVSYLTKSHQLFDLEFILQHVNDLEAVFPIRNGEVITAPSIPARKNLAI